MVEEEPWEAALFVRWSPAQRLSDSHPPAFFDSQDEYSYLNSLEQAIPFDLPNNGMRKILWPF